MARLLVSVRSAEEARLAVEAGAHIIDVKEPDMGSLGRATFSTWREVREACPPAVPVSVALGELNDWLAAEPPALPQGVWRGLSFRKLGLAACPSDWESAWADLRSTPSFSSGPPWIAVAYADWRSVGAPDPRSVLEISLRSEAIRGVLVDTFDKSSRADFGLFPQSWMEEIRGRGKLLALAGGLGLEMIPAILKLAPDIVAVRGAACFGGDRTSGIDAGRVAELARAIGSAP